MAKECASCNKAQGFFAGKPFTTINGKDYCPTCADDYVQKRTASIIITTTSNVDGFNVIKYVDIESVEIVIGTGAFSEFDSAVADFFGARSTAFEQKLQKAKNIAFQKIKLKACEKGANAVIGIDIDYTEFSGNRIGIIVNGTLAEIAPKDK